MKHFIDSYCSSCDELVEGRSTEFPCRPIYRGEGRLGQCPGGIKTRTITESVVCKNCQKKQSKAERKREKEEKKKEKEERKAKAKEKGKEKEKEKEKEDKSKGKETSVDEEEQPLTQ